MPATIIKTAAERAASSPRLQPANISHKDVTLAIPEPIATHHLLREDSADGNQSSARNAVSTLKERPARVQKTEVTRQPDEVHVHIGRIEVTAVQGPDESRPKRPTRNRRQPMSLDEYLAKRQHKP